MNELIKPIVINQFFEASAARVWRAITNPDEMRLWFFEGMNSFKPELGFQTAFDVKVEDRIFRHLWKITEVIPLEKITYNWRYEGFSGDSFVTFELMGIEGGVNLQLTHTVTVPFSREIPEFTRDSGVEGWTHFINKQLPEYLNSTN